MVGWNQSLDCMAQPDEQWTRWTVGEAERRVSEEVQRTMPGGCDAWPGRQAGRQRWRQAEAGRSACKAAAVD